MDRIDRVKAMHMLYDLVQLDFSGIKSNDIVLSHVIMNKEKDENGVEFFYARGADGIIRRLIEDNNGSIKIIENNGNVPGKDPYLIQGDIVLVYDTDGKEYAVNIDIFNKFIEAERGVI